MSKLVRTKEAAEARYAYGIVLEKGGKTEAEVAAILGYATPWGWQYLKQRTEENKDNGALCGSVPDSGAVQPLMSEMQLELIPQEQSKEELVGFRVLSLLNMKADDMLAMLDLMEEARL